MPGRDPRQNKDEQRQHALEGSASSAWRFSRRQRGDNAARLMPRPLPGEEGASRGPLPPGKLRLPMPCPHDTRLSTRRASAEVINLRAELINPYTRLMLDVVSLPVRVLVFMLGAVLVVGTVFSAIRTFV